MQYFTFCYNITKSTTNGAKYSPFELIFGRQVNLPSDFGGKIEPLYHVDDYVKELKFGLQTAHKDAKEIIDKIKIMTKKCYDKNTRSVTFKLGDRVKIQSEPYDKF